MAFMTFTALDFLRVSWLFMQAGLRPQNVLTLNPGIEQPKHSQTPSNTNQNGGFENETTTSIYHRRMGRVRV